MIEYIYAASMKNLIHMFLYSFKHTEIRSNKKNMEKQKSIS